MNISKNINKEDEKIKDMLENKVNFYELANEAYPLLEQLKELLKKYKFNNQSTHIIIGNDAYIEFHPYETSWVLRKYDCEEGPKIVFDYRNEIPLKGV